MNIRMRKMIRNVLSWTIVLALVCMSAQLLLADTAKEIDADAAAALQKLYASNPDIKKLGDNAKGILIFPHIKKAGLIVGGQGGEGCLQKAGKTVAYYKTGAASIGLQAGVQEYGYAMFFMDDESLNYLETSSGWEIGSGPSVVLVDEGFGKSMTTTTLKKGVYAAIFGQKGLMAGIGLQGSKITKIDKK